MVLNEKEQFLLAAKIIIQPGQAHARALGDGADRRIVVAFLRKNLGADVEQLFKLSIVARGGGLTRPGTRAHRRAPLLSLLRQSLSFSRYRSHRSLSIPPLGLRLETLELESGTLPLPPNPQSTIRNCYGFQSGAARRRWPSLARLTFSSGVNLR